MSSPISWEDAPFEEIKGKTLIDVREWYVHPETLHQSDVPQPRVEAGEAVFYFSDGSVYYMYHNQDCCEQVRIVDICGNWEDLIGLPLYLAQESESEAEDHETYDVGLWTFYRFATVKGYLTLRWLGESNGYYSMSVNFVKKKENQNG